MHVDGKKIAVAGLLLALTEIFLIASSVLEFNTLFLLGIASFAVGIMIREYGIKLGAAFYVASILLGFILAPNKLYCVTFGAMGAYILAVEMAWEKIGKSKCRLSKKALFWMAKYFVFNLLYLPILLVFPKLLFAGKLSTKMVVIMALGGQLVLFIYDKAYEYFQGDIWGMFRKKLGIHD
ncbi:MAG: hypothetical protein RR869_00155 [Lachnospiraceae bacterium]